MRIRLSYKLFGAFFFILLIVAGAMLLSRHIFTLSLETYIREMEMQRMTLLAQDLQIFYRENGSWEKLEGDPQQWWRLMANHLADVHALPEKPIFSGDMLPDDNDLHQADRSGPPEHLPGPPPGRPPGGGPPELLFLVNADKQLVVGGGSPATSKVMMPIEADGKTVGWLGLDQREHFKFGPPAEVLRRQGLQIYLLSGGVAALAALVALLLSRHLLRPIQQLIQGTQEVAHLDFTVRIAPGTKDELGQLAENFNAMAQTLENYETRQRQWLSDISHELRTPLSVLRAEIEALQDGVRTAGPERLTSLHTETLRIGKLVEDLHLLSMAEADNLFLDKQWMSPFEVLEALLRSFSQRFAQRGLTVSHTLDGIRTVRLKADVDRLGQVFTNLLENACRYVTTPGFLEISGQSDGHQMTVIFQDSGPGVTDATLPRLFDRLFRVESSRNRESGGSGLGLSICRRIIESHNGRIWAQKSALGGLAIVISLPLTP